MTLPTPIVLTRRPISTDVAAIKALIDLYVPEGTLLPRSEEFIAAHADDFIVAVDEGRVVGCVHLDEYAPSLAEIRSLAVDPSCQGKGIGVTLVAAAERLARMRGFTTVFAVSNNLAFFRARGFELERMRTVGGRLGCNELVLRRRDEGRRAASAPVT